MKVQDLIDRLADFDPEAEVHVAYNYGDHWDTTVAPGVSDVDEVEVVDSAYHGMPKLPRDADSDGRQVVVVSAVML